MIHWFVCSYLCCYTTQQCWGRLRLPVKPALMHLLLVLSEVCCSRLFPAPERISAIYCPVVSHHREAVEQIKPSSTQVQEQSKKKTKREKVYTPVSSSLSPSFILSFSFSCLLSLLIFSSCYLTSATKRCLLGAGQWVSGWAAAEPAGWCGCELTASYCWPTQNRGASPPPLYYCNCVPNSLSGAVPCAGVISASKVSFFSLLMSCFVVWGFHTEGGWFLWNRLSSLCVCVCLMEVSREETAQRHRMWSAFHLYPAHFSNSSFVVPVGRWCFCCKAEASAPYFKGRFSHQYSGFTLSEDEIKSI